MMSPNYAESLLNLQAVDSFRITDTTLIFRSPRAATPGAPPFHGVLDLAFAKS